MAMATPASITTTTAAPSQVLLVDRATGQSSSLAVPSSGWRAQMGGLVTGLLLAGMALGLYVLIDYIKKCKEREQEGKRMLVMPPAPRGGEPPMQEHFYEGYTA